MLQKVGIWIWDELGWFSFGVRGESYSNFLASTVNDKNTRILQTMVSEIPFVLDL